MCGGVQTVNPSVPDIGLWGGQGVESSQAADVNANADAGLRKQIDAMWQQLACLVLLSTMLQALQGATGDAAQKNSIAPAGGTVSPPAPIPSADGMPQVAPSPPSRGASSPAAAIAKPAAAVDGGGPKTFVLKNNTDQPMDVAFFRNLAPGMHPSFNGPEARFSLAPHEALRVSMPDDWQGRVQKFNGSTQEYANWAELNIEKSTGKIWFDESDIPGRNCSIKMSTPDGAVAGSDRSLLADAPSDIVSTDSSGRRVIKAPQWFSEQTNQASVNYLNRALGTTNAYVLPDDNKAVRVSTADEVTIEFGDA